MDAIDVVEVANREAIEQGLGLAGNEFRKSQGHHRDRR